MVPRVVLAACLALGSALCGKALSDAARRRANTLLALTEGLRLLRIHMTDMMEDIQTALMGVNCPLLGAVGEGMRSGVSVDDAWRAAQLTQINEIVYNEAGISPVNITIIER